MAKLLGGGTRPGRSENGGQFRPELEKGKNPGLNQTFCHCHSFETTFVFFVLKTQRGKIEWPEIGFGGFQECPNWPALKRLHEKELTSPFSC